MQVGISIRYKSFHKANAPNIALREIRKIVIIYIVVFYNTELLKQDVYYILIPKYILYLYNLAYIDGFKIYKDGFQNLETIFRESGVNKSVIYNFVINFKSSI